MSRHRIFLAGLLAALLVAVSASSAPAAAGPFQLGVRGGIYDADAFVGGEVVGRIGATRWNLNPNVEWVFVDNGDKFALNCDAVFDLRPAASLDAWVGGGLGLIFRDPDRGNDETDLGVNLVFGLGFPTSSRVKPYVQGKLVASDDSEGVLAFGVRF